MPRRNNYTHDEIYSRLSRNKCAIRASSLLVLLSGAKTACRIDAPGAADVQDPHHERTNRG